MNLKYSFTHGIRFNNDCPYASLFDDFRPYGRKMSAAEIAMLVAMKGDGA